MKYKLLFHLAMQCLCSTAFGLKMQEFATLEEALAQYPHQYSVEVVLVKRLTLKVTES